MNWNPMHSTLTALLIFACLWGAVWFGTMLGRLLPEHHLSADTKETVKLAVGLVATMAALLLGLLVSSAKSSYDATRSQVIQTAAKITLLDRALTIYGPEAADTRARVHAVVGEVIRQLWPEDRGAPPGQLDPDTRAGNSIYAAIQELSPRDDTQRVLKARATALAEELAQFRALLVVQSVSSISRPMLVVVVSWVVVIFFGFSLIAPRNATARFALSISALSVAGAIFLILELDRPFGGLVQISSEPMRNALSYIEK